MRTGTGPTLPHLHRDWARPCHICTGTGLAPPTSAPGLGSPLPHLHRDWARPSHICTGTGPTPGTSAPGLSSPRPHLRRDRPLPRRSCALRVQPTPTLAHRIDHALVAALQAGVSPFSPGRGVPSPSADVAGVGPSPGADVAEVGPVPVQMEQGRATSRCRYGRGEPS
jgi:hypothetical protein